MTRSTTGAAKRVSLNRVAHVAGEAFAFAEPEPAAPTAHRHPLIGGILWLTIAAAVAAALWVGLQSI